MTALSADQVRALDPDAFLAVLGKAKETGGQVVAADISPLMRERAEASVAAAGLNDLDGVEDADILGLPYPDGSFDVVLAEAVTMFVNRRRAAAELACVWRPGGRVLATEWRPPTEEARKASSPMRVLTASRSWSGA